MKRQANGWRTPCEMKIFTPLRLAEVTECLRRGLDPPCVSGRVGGNRYACRVPHRIVLHVHCVNTIAWAVRNDAPIPTKMPARRATVVLDPYVASGLPLSRAIEKRLFASPRTRICRSGKSRTDRGR